MAQEGDHEAKESFSILATKTPSPSGETRPPTPAEDHQPRKTTYRQQQPPHHFIQHIFGGHEARRTWPVARQDYTPVSFWLSHIPLEDCYLQRPGRGHEPHRGRPRSSPSPICHVSKHFVVVRGVKTYALGERRELAAVDDEEDFLVLPLP